MSKLIEKIEDEIRYFEGCKQDEPAKERLQVLKAFRAFVESAEKDLTEEEFQEYSQDALAVWEDE